MNWFERKKKTQYYLLVTCDHLLQYCAPNKTEIKKAVLIEYAFHFVAGDLYPLAFGSNSLDLGTLTLKADSLKKLNPLGGFDRICIQKFVHEAFLHLFYDHVFFCIFLPAVSLFVFQYMKCCEAIISHYQNI